MVCLPRHTKSYWSAVIFAPAWSTPSTAFHSFRIYTFTIRLRSRHHKKSAESRLTNFHHTRNPHILGRRATAHLFKHSDFTPRKHNHHVRAHPRINSHVLRSPLQAPHQKARPHSSLTTSLKRRSPLRQTRPRHPHPLCLRPKEPLRATRDRRKCTRLKCWCGIRRVPRVQGEPAEGI